MPQLAVDGAELTYDDEGPRDAGTAPLVFLHGWTADRHRWDHQMAHFAPHRRVIRLDLRGHGESGGTGRAPSRTSPGTSPRSSTTWESAGSCPSVTRWAA